MVTAQLQTNRSTKNEGSPETDLDTIYGDFAYHVNIRVRKTIKE